MIREFNTTSAKWRGAILMEENANRRKAILKHLIAIANVLSPFLSFLISQTNHIL
jgi:hypothetical protein